MARCITIGSLGWVVLVFAGCGGGGGGAEDADQDGYSVDVDCDDGDAAVHPGASEIFGNGIDDDCDATTHDADQDGDGDPRSTDCDDTDPTRYAGATEVDDGIDQDCDGDRIELGLFDGDSDGFTALYGSASLAVPDCDDNDPAVHPSATEIYNNAVDDDCSFATVDSDADMDGHAANVDCDDNDPAAHPGATELDDGVDQDCDGDRVELGLFDADGDGFTPGYGSLTVAVADCNDASAFAFPGAAQHESGGASACMLDADDDGYGDSLASGSIAAGTDCLDNDRWAHPGAPEVADDGLDNDCAGGDLTAEASLAAGTGAIVSFNGSWTIWDAMFSSAYVTCNNANPGTIDEPLCDIDAALALAGVEHIIVVGEVQDHGGFGAIHPPANIARSVHLSGGYHIGVGGVLTRSQTPGQYPSIQATTVDHAAAISIVVPPAAGPLHVVIDRVHARGESGGLRASTSGIAIDGDANVAILDSFVESGWAHVTSGATNAQAIGISATTAYDPASGPRLSLRNVTVGYRATGPDLSQATVESPATGAAKSIGVSESGFSLDVDRCVISGGKAHGVAGSATRAIVASKRASIRESLIEGGAAIETSFVNDETIGISSPVVELRQSIVNVGKPLLGDSSITGWDLSPDNAYGARIYGWVPSPIHGSVFVGGAGVGNGGTPNDPSSIIGIYSQAAVQLVGSTIALEHDRAYSLYLEHTPTGEGPYTHQDSYLINNLLVALGSGPGWSAGVVTPGHMLTLHNNLFWNFDDFVANPAIETATIDVVNDCAALIDCYASSGNLSADPGTFTELSLTGLGFDDQTALVPVGLPASSPAVDAGIDPRAIVPLGQHSYDLVGSVRPDASGLWDIGAHEQ